MKDHQRLRPEQRLRRQDSFKNLVEKGTFARGHFFYVWVVPRQELSEKSTGNLPVAGIVVNRKTQALATKRNMLKRRVREIFRKRQSGMKEGVAVLIKVKEGGGLPDSQDMERDLVELFKKAGAMK